MTTVACPCCGALLPASDVPFPVLRDVPMKPKSATLVTALIRAFPRPLSTDHLMNVLYGADPNGGPLYGRKIISIHMADIRRAIAAYGWTVTSGKVGRGSQGLYRLSKIGGAA